MRITKSRTVAIILLMVVVGLVGCLGTQPAQAIGLFGKTKYSVRFTAQAGVYLRIDGQKIVGRGLVSTGDKFSGEAKVSLDGREFAFLKCAPYNFELPCSVEELADGLPHSVEIYCTTYRPYSKDWKKRGKHLPDWGAAASATFCLQKVPVHSAAEEEQIARANAERQLGRNDGKHESRSDADDLASFFSEDGGSNASASASASASAATDSYPVTGSYSSAQASASASANASNDDGISDDATQARASASAQVASVPDAPDDQLGCLTLTGRPGQRIYVVVRQNGRIIYTTQPRVAIKADGRLNLRGLPTPCVVEVYVGSAIDQRLVDPRVHPSAVYPVR
jgi:hypothetical protein